MITVKKLEWDENLTAVTEFGFRYTVYQEFSRDVDCWAVNTLDGVFLTIEAAKAAAQADYEARILPALEPFANSYPQGANLAAHSKNENGPDHEPSPRAQALEEGDNICARLEGLASWLDGSQHSKWCGRKEVPIHGYSGEGKLVRAAIAAIRALSHPASPDMGVERPVADGWLPIETAPNNKAILVHYDDGNIELISSDDNEYSWIAYTVKEDFCTKPTHWCPLPASPGVAG